MLISSSTRPLGFVTGVVCHQYRCLARLSNQEQNGEVDYPLRQVGKRAGEKDCNCKFYEGRMENDQKRSNTAFNL